MEVAKEVYVWGESMWDGVGAQRSGREGARERARGRGWEGHRQGQREKARRLPHRTFFEGLLTLYALQSGAGCGESKWDGAGAQRGGCEGAQGRVRGRGWEGHRQG